MRDHRDTHAMERTRYRVFRNDVDDVRHRYGRPVDTNKVAISIVALGFTMTSKTTVRAVRAATFGVGKQQIQAARAFTTVHATAHDPQRDRCRCRQLHIFGRLHVRRENIIIRQVHALRRDVIRFDVLAVLAIGRRLQRRAGLHHIERIKVAAVFCIAGRRLCFVFNTAH